MLLSQFQVLIPGQGLTQKPVCLMKQLLTGDILISFVRTASLVRCNCVFQVINSNKQASKLTVSKQTDSKQANRQAISEQASKKRAGKQEARCLRLSHSGSWAVLFLLGPSHSGSWTVLLYRQHRHRSQRIRRRRILTSFHGPVLCKTSCSSTRIHNCYFCCFRALWGDW